MSDLEKWNSSPVANSVRSQYERLERDAKELLNRDFSLVERFVTNSKLARLSDRLRVEEQEEALRGRLEAMQLTRVTALNEQQIQLRSFLSAREIQCNAELLDRAAGIYQKLFDKLADRDYELATSFEAKYERLEQLKIPQIKERHREQLGELLDQNTRMMKTLFDSSNQALETLRTAYSARTPLDNKKG
jgi:hypothetical protein